jgi:hypothetical protein
MAQLSHFPAMLSFPGALSTELQQKRSAIEPIPNAFCAFHLETGLSFAKYVK